MREVITHPGDIDPRNVELGREYLGVDRFDRLTDFDQSHAHCIEYQPVLDSTALEVAGDRISRCKNVYQTLIIMTTHSAIASVRI